MNRHLNILAALVTVAVFAAPSGADEDAASQLQSYQLTDLEGVEHSLREHRGEVVVVNFWASWCAPCLKELPMLDAWHAEWADRGARVAAISVDHNPKKARRFIDKAGLGLDVYHDGPDGLASQLDLPFLPCTYVLDQSGAVVLISGGSNDEELTRIQSTVEGLLSSSAALETASAHGGAR
jgi:thiol-disulfide isomerase/thioredoxin